MVDGDGWNEVKEENARSACRTARHGTARHGTARLGSARLGSARHGWARHGEARRAAARDSDLRLTAHGPCPVAPAPRLIPIENE
ncbi:hypothetical protein DN552_22415 [Burkholderia multivorans]|nr:hypothetical protein DN552_22415 [Burkholderia multivorans]